MAIRPEFNFPSLDAAKVERLADLASQLDGAGPGQCDDELRDFNESAGTDIPLAEFQGIYGGCLLYTSPSPRDATLSRMPSSA